MKKLLSLIAIVAVMFTFSVNAKTLEERINSVETKYEQRIEKINTMRGSDARKEILRKHAREDADLKIQHLKDLEKVKTVRKSKKATA